MRNLARRLESIEPLINRLVIEEGAIIEAASHRKGEDQEEPFETAQAQGRSTLPSRLKRVLSKTGRDFKKKGPQT